MPSTHETTLARLRRAFPSHPIHSAGAFAEWGGTYLDGHSYSDELNGKCWDQLDSAFMVRRSDALGFLGTRHLVEVLPVYLHELVVGGSASPAVGMVALILTKPAADTEGLGGKRFSALVEALTPEQRTAVAQSLYVFSDEHSDSELGRAVRTALDRYWGQHVPTDAVPPSRES